MAKNRRDGGAEQRARAKNRQILQGEVATYLTRDCWCGGIMLDSN